MQLAIKLLYSLVIRFCTSYSAIFVLYFFPNFSLSAYLAHVALFSFCTFSVLCSFRVSLFLWCIFSHVVLFLCCTFSMLLFLHVAFSLYCTLFMFHYFIHISCFLCATFFFHFVLHSSNISHVFLSLFMFSSCFIFSLFYGRSVTLPRYGKNEIDFLVNYAKIKRPCQGRCINSGLNISQDTSPLFKHLQLESRICWIKKILNKPVTTKQPKSLGHWQNNLIQKMCCF